MPRSTIIFGNGLGMAIDSQYFTLKSGLQWVWNKSDHFKADQKRLVASAIRLRKDEYPKSEEQLDHVQLAITASNFLRSFESREWGVKWLSDESRGFPEAFRRFVHEVGWYFHDSRKEVPDKFGNSLSHFIKHTKSHVATLNYDNLLYDFFHKTKVLNGFDLLLDGFLSEGFQIANLGRHYPNRQGWYLHLHGSPLYTGNNKKMGPERARFEPNEASHIVLTYLEHKPTVIDSSHILKEYWNCLLAAFKESEKVILFGYSGEDKHLNEKIAQHCSRRAGKSIIVIEWEDSGAYKEREAEWKKRLDDCEILLRHLPNVLEFDWSEMLTLLGSKGSKRSPNGARA